MTFSVVIPAHNVAAWLRRAIESVKAQQRDIEIVVVDDGSTDGTADVAASYEDVRLIVQDNAGPSKARNVGAAASTADTILFLDADDELLPGAVDAFEAAFEDAAGAGAIVPNRLVCSSSGTEAVLWPALEGLRMLDRRDVLQVIRKHDLGMNAAVRRAVWDASPFREDLRASEDQAFWIDVLMQEVPIALIPQPVVRYRTDRDGAASGSKRVMRGNRARLLMDLAMRNDLTIVERSVALLLGLRARVGCWTTR